MLIVIDHVTESNIVSAMQIHWCKKSKFWKFLTLGFLGVFCLERIRENIVRKSTFCLLFFIKQNFLAITKEKNLLRVFATFWYVYIWSMNASFYSPLNMFFLLSDAPKQIKSYKKSHTKEWKKIGPGKICKIIEINNTICSWIGN